MSCAGKSIVQLGAKGGGQVQNDASPQTHLTPAASQTLSGRLDSMYPSALPSLLTLRYSAFLPKGQSGHLPFSLNTAPFPRGAF